MQTIDSPTQAGPLPIGFECPGCRYDLAASSRRMCPECGRPVSTADLVAFRACIDASTHIRGLIRATAYAGVAAGTLAWVSSALYASNIYAGVVLGLTIAGYTVSSIGLGFVAARLSPRREHAAWFLAWLKLLYWLHGPWLVVPILLGTVFLADKVNAGAAASVFVGVCWVIWVFACLSNWFESHAGARNCMGLGRRSSTLAFSICALACLLLSAALSIAVALGILGPLQRF